MGQQLALELEEHRGELDVVEEDLHEAIRFVARDVYGVGEYSEESEIVALLDVGVAVHEHVERETEIEGESDESDENVEELHTPLTALAAPVTPEGGGVLRPVPRRAGKVARLAEHADVPSLTSEAARRILGDACSRVVRAGEDLICGIAATPESVSHEDLILLTEER